MFPIEEATIFLAVAGSQAHGTARVGSDLDLRGVCVAPIDVRLSLHRNFEQFDGVLPSGLAESLERYAEGNAAAADAVAAADVKSECVIFEIAKFLALCAASNPNALEILFTDERDWVVATPTWRELHQQRHVFLCQRIQQTFLGYATAQLKRIKSHRSWLISPPRNAPAREDFGLPPHGSALSRDDQNRVEQSISEKIRSYQIDELEMPKSTRVALHERLVALQCDVLGVGEERLDERLGAVAMESLGLPPAVIAALTAEKRYRAAMKQWDSYQSWLTHRNPARAELERRFGYDTKHGMHLIRLMRMCVEALETGELHVRRSDAVELVAIRDGAFDYDALIEMAQSLETAAALAVKSTKLPPDIDRAYVDELLLRVVHSVR